MSRLCRAISAVPAKCNVQLKQMHAEKLKEVAIPIFKRIVLQASVLTQLLCPSFSRC